MSENRFPTSRLSPAGQRHPGHLLFELARRHTARGDTAQGAQNRFMALSRPSSPPAPLTRSPQCGAARGSRLPLPTASPSSDIKTSKTPFGVERDEFQTKATLPISAFPISLVRAAPLLTKPNSPRRRRALPGKVPPRTLPQGADRPPQPQPGPGSQPAHSPGPAAPPRAGFPGPAAAACLCPRRAPRPGCRSPSDLLTAANKRGRIRLHPRLFPSSRRAQAVPRRQHR